MVVPIAVEARPVPLSQDESGTWRVTGSRIPLERIIECHCAGQTPEEIAGAFDSLRLSDVYAVISYYLDHKGAVDEYLRLQEQKAEELREMIEAGQPPRPGFKAELLRRRAELEGKNAPPGQ